MEKLTFALYFGNRGFFPGELVAAARADMQAAVKKSGNLSIVMDEKLTKYGAIETAEDGRKYAAFLKANAGKFDGVIICMPNFSDENGVIPALRDCGVPILIQAYEDEIGKMDFDSRRDSYCGKFSFMDVFYQFGVKFTVFPPHVCNPDTKEFADQLTKFAAVCRVVKGMKRFIIGGLGARTTQFKTVRYDELALERYGITMDAYDLSEVFDRINKYKDDKAVKAKAAEIAGYTDCGKCPAGKSDLIAKTILVIEDMMRDYKMDAIALRCWNEFEQMLGISPCVVLSYFNDKMIAAACEMDIMNGIVMRALSLASGSPSACLDWNNNYGKAKDKCILFHCGPVAFSMMEGKGTVTDHKMFAKSYGQGCGFGSNEGRIKKGGMTFASAKTESGKLYTYLGRGKMTGEDIEKSFFGCGGVAEIKDLEQKILFMGKNGYRHHCSMTFGDVYEAVAEAFTNYLGYEVKLFD